MKDTVRGGLAMKAAVLALALLGAAVNVYLGIQHWQVHNVPGHVSFCNISSAVNCDAVALSAYSWLLGMPVSYWGLVYYLLLCALATWGSSGRQRAYPWLVAAVAVGPGLGFSARMALVSHLLVGSVCIFCLSLYVIALAMAVAVALPLPGNSRRAAICWMALCMLAGAGWFSIADYGRLGSGEVLAVLSVALLAALAAQFVPPGLRWKQAWLELAQQLRLLARSRAFVAGCAVFAIASVTGLEMAAGRLYASAHSDSIAGAGNIPTGRTEQGHPWIGASNPRLVIREYSDYECPFCRRAHRIVRRLVGKYSDRVRLVHINVPLDHSCNPMVKRPFHKHACECAQASLCADEQGRFWRMNDLLYGIRCNLEATSLEELARKAGLDVAKFRNCMGSGKSKKRLEKDLAECNELVQECRRAGRGFGTPTYIVGEEVVVGLKPEKFWQQLIERKLNEAG